MRNAPLDDDSVCFLLLLLQAKEGQEVTFTCKVNGEPYPEVTWFLKGQRLTPSERCIITDDVDRQTHTLRLVGISAEDAGMVEVNATNTLGQVSCSANLDVEGWW